PGLERVDRELVAPGTALRRIFGRVERRKRGRAGEGRADLLPCDRIALLIDEHHVQQDGGSGLGLERVREDDERVGSGWDDLRVRLPAARGRSDGEREQGGRVLAAGE